MKNNFSLKTLSLLLFVGTTSLAVPVQEYTLIPDINFESRLISLGIDTDGANGKVLTSSISGVTSLVITNAQISDLTGIEDFTALTELSCGYNRFKILDLSKNIALTFLECFNNRFLSSLDFSKNINLSVLDCSYNQITSLDVTKNTALIRLKCHELNLTSLDVTKNTALTDLDCGKNSLTSLDVTKNTALTYLDCSINSDLKTICVFSIAAVNANPDFTKDASASWSETCGLTTSLFENQAFTSIIYPNPSQGNLTIELANSAQVIVTDILGKEVFQTTLNAGKNNLQLNTVSKGIYLVKINSNTSQTVQQLLVE